MFCSFSDAELASYRYTLGYYGNRAATRLHPKVVEHLRSCEFHQQQFARDFELAIEEDDPHSPGVKTPAKAPWLS